MSLILLSKWLGVIQMNNTTMEKTIKELTIYNLLSLGCQNNCMVSDNASNFKSRNLRQYYEVELYQTYSYGTLPPCHQW